MHTNAHMLRTVTCILLHEFVAAASACYVIFATSKVAVGCYSTYVWYYGSGSSIVPVACYSAFEIVWHRWEQPLAAACRGVPVAAIVSIFPFKVHIPAL